MKRSILKIAFIVFGLLFLGLIGTCLYQIACISCTPLAIKVYSYKGSMDDLEQRFRSFEHADEGINIKVTKRGSGPFDARDVILQAKSQSTNVVYDMVIHDFNGTTQLSLDCIHDQLNNINGCNIEDLKTDSLFNEFKEHFLPILKEKGIDLKPTFFNF